MSIKDLKDKNRPPELNKPEVIYQEITNEIAKKVQRIMIEEMTGRQNTETLVYQVEKLREMNESQKNEIIKNLDKFVNGKAEIMEMVKSYGNAVEEMNRKVAKGITGIGEEQKEIQRVVKTEVKEINEKIETWGNQLVQGRVFLKRLLISQGILLGLLIYLVIKGIK